MMEFPPEGGVDSFYDVIRKWDQVLRRKEHEYWTQLVPGRVLSNLP
jgi:trimethyllysine dioxygenase